MIVDGMTEKEVMEEIKSDLLNACLRYTKAETKFRRAVIKTKVFPIRTCIKYNSPRKNRWIICLEAHNKKMRDKKTLMSYSVLHDSDHGIYVKSVMVVNKVFKIHIFPPHFFSRYAERCNIDKNGEDLIIHFLQNNTSLSYCEIGDGDVYFGVECSCQDGIALGSITVNQNYLFRTFITRDLARGKQIEDFKKLDDFRLGIDKKQ